MSPAREVAFRVLQRVHGGGYASDLLRRECATLASRDAGLAEAIVLGCLRYQSQLDFLTGQFSGRPQPKLDDEIRIALRMGIYQVRYLDRIPTHAAVTESVELVKRAGKRSAAGFVNAVLRKVNREPVTWPDPATGLSVPAWMLERWRRQYGAEAAEKIARAALEEPRAYVNPDTGRQQDIGSQAIVPLLELKPGITLLDLCAAPGNKTAQALALGARVVACDRYPRRLADVPAAAARVVLDATEPLPFFLRFDRILIDAPCSGTGTLARNPEIKWRLQPAELTRFQASQKKMIERGLEHLKPGGRLVYSTCSLESEENGGVVAGRNVLDTRLRLPGRDAGDGFFAAVIAL
jgi:16S rRNA (cytosine967-C5)-methyltransferase